MKKMMKAVAGCLFFVSIWTTVSASDVSSDYQQAKRAYEGALSSLAAYGDKAGQLARSECLAQGWTIQELSREDEKSRAECLLLRKQAAKETPSRYILAIPGTVDKKDMKSDLRTKSVPFHDGDARAAGTAEVHTGFRDYAHTILATPYQKGTLGDALYTMIHSPRQDVLITGHSLGGAAASLIGARLADRGLPPGDIHVVTFGAPAVGNDAFVSRYALAMDLDRVVIKGDPVEKALQAMRTGFTQFPQETVWKEDIGSRHFQHSMVVYTDAALRHYYDAKWAYEQATGKQAYIDRRPVVHSDMYIAPPVTEIDEDLLEDKPYMRAVVHNALYRSISGAVYSPAYEEAIATACGRAKAAGKRYVLQEYIHAAKIKDKENLYRITVEMDVFDTSGRVLSAEGYTTDTSDFTPILAVLYCQKQIKL